MNYITADELEVCWEVRRMCACDQLRRVTRGVTQVYDSAMGPSGLRITQLPIFVGLASEGDLPLHADDARVRMVSITLEGSRMLTAALECWAQVQEFVEERFGRERLVALEDELAALSRALDA